MISGKVYEAIKKIVIYPEKDFTTILKEGVKYIGHFSISFKYTVHVPAYSIETIFYILSNEDAKDLSYRLAFLAIADKENWKRPTEGAFKTNDEKTAVFLLNAVVHFVGGAYLIEGDDGHYYVWSKGYYHYIGA